jgi:hypothetical protein
MQPAELNRAATACVGVGHVCYQPLAAERLTPFCRREAAGLTLESGPADMARLVRTLRVRRGVPRRQARTLGARFPRARSKLMLGAAISSADHEGSHAT